MSTTVFQVVGLTIAILSLVALFVVPYLGKPKKLITYRSTSISVARVRDFAKSDVSITVHGRPVPAVFSTIVRFANKGNQPIVPTDFHEPLGVAIPAEFEILNAGVTHPGKSINWDVPFQKTFVAVPSALLNPGDEVTLNVTTTCYPDSIAIAGRVEGAPLRAAQDVSRDRWLRAGALWITAKRWRVFAFTALCCVPLSLSLVFVVRQGWLAKAEVLLSAFIYIFGGMTVAFTWRPR